MNSALVQLIFSRIREFYREPAAIFWVYGFPIIMALILGFAFQSRPVEKIAIDLVVPDPEMRPSLQAEAEKMKAADERLVITLNDEATARSRLRTDKTSLMLIPDRDAGRFALEFDNNRPGSVLAKAAVEMVLLKRVNPNDVGPTATQTVSDSGGRYIDFLMPGLIGANLMGGGLFGVGFLIVDIRVRKLLKRFLATPMKKTDFMLGIMISRLIFTIGDIVILLGAAMLLFGVRIQGNWFALAAMILLGGVCFSGLGLLVASRAKTLETASGLLNAIMLPMYLVSGVFFSSSNFPPFVQPIIGLLPLTVLNDGLRAIINEGKGFEDVWWPAIVLTAWSLVSFFAALKLFRWR